VLDPDPAAFVCVAFTQTFPFPTLPDVPDQAPPVAVALKLSVLAVHELLV
jgi:hypothetical protein